jgi:hypothetical protein
MYHLRAIRGKVQAHGPSSTAVGFNDLPNDIIAEVFKAIPTVGLPPVTCHKADWPEGVPMHEEFQQRRRVPRTVLRVCRLWRQVGKENPPMWSMIKVVLAQNQDVSTNRQTVMVHNQAEVDTLAELALSQPIQLCFGTSSKVARHSLPTPFRIDGLLEKVSAVLLDSACPNLLSTFSALLLPNLSSVHVGDSRQFNTGRSMGSMEWHYFAEARFWMSKVGTKKLVWSATNYRGLSVGLDWGGLTELRICNRYLTLSEWDLCGLLEDCTSLQTLGCLFSPYSQLPCRINRSESVIGARTLPVRNTSLVTLLLGQATEVPHGRTPNYHQQVLAGLELPNLEHLVVEPSQMAYDPQVRWMANPATVGAVESLQLCCGSVDDSTMAAILRAMPRLRDLTLAAYPCPGLQDDTEIIGFGIEDCTLNVVRESARNLRSFKAFGESWLSTRALGNFGELNTLDL